jgi:ABC-type uncharacterized transport system substrate-binding protein
VSRKQLAAKGQKSNACREASLYLSAYCSLSFCPLSQRRRSSKTKLRIGFLAINSVSSSATSVEAFRLGLRQLGYIEGQNIIIEWRYADGRSDRLPDLAAELVRIKVDVIVTSATSPTEAAKKATNTIPIVIASHNDPIGAGLVASLARPGGNVTGLSNIAIELSGKRLELLKEMVPKLSRVAILRIPSAPATPPQMKEMEGAAHFNRPTGRRSTIWITPSAQWSKGILKL